MKTNDLTFTLFSAGLMLLLYLTLSNLATQEHEHKKAILHYPSGFHQETIEICGDSSIVRYNEHLPLYEHTRDWIEYPISDE